MSRASRFAFALAALGGIALFATLGSWQYGRGIEKRERLAQQADALAGTPTPLPDAMRNAATTPVQAVVGRGEFRTPLLLLDSQQREGRVGVRVYGIATVEGASAALMVDLGWMPMGPTRIVPAPQAPAGPRELRGLLAPWPGQGLRAAANPWPKAGSEPVLLTYLDAQEIEREFGLTLHPGVMRLAPDVDYGYARDLDALPNTLPPERHFGYAVQWFGLAATVAVVYLVLTWRSRRRKSAGIRSE